jgi:hypothetical protein
MKNKRRIAGVLIAVGLACYLVNLVVYVPKFSAYMQALNTWNHTISDAAPNPAAYGLDTAAFIISPSLTWAATILVLVGGGYLLAVLVASIARRFGHLEKEPEILKDSN